MNMLFTIFAFVFFGTLLVFDNNVLVSSISLSSENEVSLIAFSEAQSVIEEAKLKAFDENTVAGAVTDSTSFSVTMGREAGETFPYPVDTVSSALFKSSMNFDDIDDYNGYTRVVKTSSEGKGDTVITTVSYVKITNPDSAVSGKMYQKKMTVTVKSPYIPRSYSFSYVFAY